MKWLICFFLLISYSFNRDSKQTIENKFNEIPFSNSIKSKETVFYPEKISLAAQFTKKEDTEITVAVIDSGIYPHERLKNNIISFTDLVNKKTAPYDDSGHGTSIAGIITGNGSQKLSNIKIASLKVLDYNNKGNQSLVSEAIQWAIKNKDRFNIKVINLSIGLKEDVNETLTKAINLANQNNMIIVNSIGNTKNYHPIVCENIINVGSLKDSFVENNNYYTVSNDIYTTESDIYYQDGVSENNNFTKVEGTSFSTAVITQLIAEFLSKEPNATIREVRAFLEDDSNYYYEYKNNNFILVRKYKGG